MEETYTPFKAYKAELWGNDDDGYEVNDWYPCETIEIKNYETIDDAEIVNQLIDQGFFVPDVRNMETEISDSSDTEFFIETTASNKPRELFKFTRDF